MDEFLTRPHQLELAFEGQLEHCPVCRPSSRDRDIFRPLCERHLREHEAAFDAESFRRYAEEALERGRKDVDAFRRIMG